MNSSIDTVFAMLAVLLGIWAVIWIVLRYRPRPWEVGIETDGGTEAFVQVIECGHRRARKAAVETYCRERSEENRAKGRAGQKRRKAKAWATSATPISWRTFFSRPDAALPD